MIETTASINTRLIDSLAQIILSLTDYERQVLAQKIQYPLLSNEELQRKREALHKDLALGVEQLKNGEYVEYDESSLLNLLENIKMLGKQRIQPNK
jgi:hypothetical protein